MDKKKVKELIENTIRFIKARDEEYIHGKVKSYIVSTLQVALEELSKSDWVSVEDELPPYGERVDVCDKASPTEVYQTRREKASAGLIIDNNDFVGMFINITHWKHIEKLEE